MMEQTEDNTPSALRLVYGFGLLYLVYFLYIVFFPQFLVVSQALMGTINGMIAVNAPISAGSVFALAQTVTLTVSSVFILIFTGIAIYVAISSVHRSQGTSHERSITVLAEAFLILGCIAGLAYAFDITNHFIISADTSYAANALNTPEYSIMTLVTGLIPAIAMFATLVHVIRNSGSSNEAYE